MGQVKQANWDASVNVNLYTSLYQYVGWIVDVDPYQMLEATSSSDERILNKYTECITVSELRRATITKCDIRHLSFKMKRKNALIMKDDCRPQQRDEHWVSELFFFKRGVWKINFAYQINISKSSSYSIK